MELKKKDFISQASTHIRDKNPMGTDGFWACVSRDLEGRMLGWVLGFSTDDDQIVLSTDKGSVRVFKTTDAIVRFISDANLICTYGSVCSVRLDFA